jgi:hypothetical protein
MLWCRLPAVLSLSIDVAAVVFAEDAYDSIGSHRYHPLLYSSGDSLPNKSGFTFQQQQEGDKDDDGDGEAAPRTTAVVASKEPFRTYYF